MKVLMTGASGLIGSATAESLAGDGCSILRLVRRPPRDSDAEARWDPPRSISDVGALEGCDAVVHLAGENIAAGRWSPVRWQRITSSRVDTTRLLCETLSGLERPPAVIVCASAIGFYGNRGNEILTEDSPPGTGPLADLCRAWEDAASPALEAGIRVIHLRFGMVLSDHGGALAKMLPIFRRGLGGRLGSGRQFVSWIGLEDAIRMIGFCLRTESVAGPVNATAPEPVTNKEFTRILGKVLGKPAPFPAPAFALRLAFGRMADELLLAGARVVPQQLEQKGFTFQGAGLETALRRFPTLH